LNDSFEEALRIAGDFLTKNGLAIGASVVLLVAVERIISVLSDRYIADQEKLHIVKRRTRLVTFLLGVLWVFMLYTTQQKSDVIIIVGIVLAGVALTLREVLTSIVGWFLIVGPKGFRHGDRVEVGALRGDVIDIGLLRTTIAEIGNWVDADQSTGRLITMPNSAVLGCEVKNYTAGHEFIWDEYKILVTFESDWKKAEQILERIAQSDFVTKQEQLLQNISSVRKKYPLRYTVVTPKIYTTIADSGILLTMRYMVRARRRRGIKDSFSRLILDAFNHESTIEFAYPTYRLYTAPSAVVPAELQK